MCYQVICYECNKPTWGGCGHHVAELLSDIPKEQRCECPKPQSFREYDTPGELIRELLCYPQPLTDLPNQNETKVTTIRC